MKKSLILVGMLSIGYAYAQEGNVGINTENPKATLEVLPNSANLTKTTNEGIIAPKLTKARIAGIADANLVEGTLVYATDNTYTGANTKVSKITEKGYYFYNGTEWVKVQYQDTDTNDAEWVYDDATKRIKLKRSGAGNFKNQVFYDVNTGAFRDVDFGLDINGTSIVYTDDATFAGYEPYNAIVKQASNISNTTLTSYMDYNAIVLDNKAKKAPYRGIGMSITQKGTEATDTESLYSYISSINLANAGSVGTLGGISNGITVSNENMALTGGITGYTSNITNASSSKASEIRGSYSNITLSNKANADNVVNDFKAITFNGNTGSYNEVTLDNTYAVFQNNAAPTIENFYLYKGRYFKQATSSMDKIKNAYGLYLQNINFAAEKNYAIYTNLGNVYFGDKVGVRVENPTERLEVAGNILAKQGRLMSQSNTNEGGAVELINDKKTDVDDVKKWTIFNMTTPYVKGLHFWAYGEDGSSRNSQMFLTDSGQLAVGFGNARADQLSITEKLEVNGNAKIKGLRGSGDRAVYVDSEGVLKVGTATASTPAPAVAIGSTASMECNATNRGKMNFIQGTDGKSDVFGICMKNADGNYYWGYMVGGNNPTNGTGAFGSGL